MLTMPHNKQAVVFDCAGDALIGVLNASALPASHGVLIVVGGPQYRVGSHRQFTLLARQLAQHGVPTLRFDYRGMGDSEAEVRTFEDVGADIRCAIDRFFASVPGLQHIVLWGLCDGASAALFYAHQDTRVSGLVLLNPWVRTEQGVARVHLRHYYVRRLFQASLWQKVVRGELNIRGAAAELGKFVADAMGRVASPGAVEKSPAGATPLPDRMEDALRRFQGRALLILSGNDLVAQEFKDVVAASSRWRRLLAGDRVTRYDLPEANHTFARREWRDQVARWTEAWVKSL